MLRSRGGGGRGGGFLEAKDQISFIGLRIHYHWLVKLVEKVQITHYHKLVVLTG